MPNRVLWSLRRLINSTSFLLPEMRISQERHMRVMQEIKMSPLLIIKLFRRRGIELQPNSLADMQPLHNDIVSHPVPATGGQAQVSSEGQSLFYSSYCWAGRAGQSQCTLQAERTQKEWGSVSCSTFPTLHPASSVTSLGKHDSSPRSTEATTDLTTGAYWVSSMLPDMQ